jgi:DNA-binding HxlR family transcriptional regulator
MTFRALQDAAATNPSLLNTRLAELRAAALVIHEGLGYQLAPTGQTLLEALSPLSVWASRWAAQQAKKAERSKEKP